MADRHLLKRCQAVLADGMIVIIVIKDKWGGGSFMSFECPGFGVVVVELF